MRIVADANVFVSAALGRSPAAPSARIITAALDGRIELRGGRPGPPDAR